MSAYSVPLTGLCAMTMGNESRRCAMKQYRWTGIVAVGILAIGILGCGDTEVSFAGSYSITSAAQAEGFVGYTRVTENLFIDDK